MEPQDELQKLLTRQEALKQELAAKKTALQEGPTPPAPHPHPPDPPRPGASLRRRPQTPHPPLDPDRLLLDSVSQADPVSMTRLMKGLDEFLERDQDRALFNLPPRLDPKPDA